MHKLTVVDSRGQSLIELILAIAIASFFLTSFVLGIIYVREAYSRTSTSAQAKLLLQKEIEALRSIKETNWNSFSTPGTYHVVQSGSSWVVAPGNIDDNNLTHGFTVANACRLQATSGVVDCAAPGAIPDPGTKKITAIVSWNLLSAHSITSSLYLTRNFNNSTITQTTQADFNAGIKTNTTVTNSSGGEVQLAPSSNGNWNSPQVVASRKLGGTVGANDVFVDNNKAYIVTNSQTGADFFIYDVTNPASTTALGSYDLAANGFRVFVSGNYAYIASSETSQELTILNVSNPVLPTLAGAFNSATGSDGRGVYVVGSIAYLVTDNNNTGVGYEFYAVNVTNPASPVLLGGRNLNASAREVTVVGNYAYIASTSNTQELQVVNISNPTLPTLAGTFNASGNTDANSIFVLNNTAYLATGQLSLLNVTNPGNISQIGSYSVTGTPFGVFVSGNYAFLTHSQAGSEFKVVDITNPLEPTLFGSANLGGQGNRVFVVGDYAYVATANPAAQFQIVHGGIGGAYQSSGTFESSTISLSTAGTFNYLSMTINEPASTTLRLQIATDNGVWTYVGPDGTPASYFDTPGAINLAKISSQYFRYKAFLTGNGLVTPTLFDVTVNYSP